MLVAIFCVISLFQTFNFKRFCMVLFGMFNILDSFMSLGKLMLEKYVLKSGK